MARVKAKVKAKVEVEGVETGGEISNAKRENPNIKLKVQMEQPLGGGKTSSERELYFFYNYSQATSGKKPVLSQRRPKRLNRRKNMFEWRRASFFGTS
jgi:hypothetical protein